MQCAHARGGQTEAQITHGGWPSHPWAQGTCPTPARAVFESDVFPRGEL